jgi:hypothetical protein
VAGKEQLVSFWAIWIKLNRSGLPKGIRVSGFRLAALGFAVPFYGFFAGWYVIVQIGELV